MINSLEKIRNKPEHIRKMILIVSTTALTGIIFVVWFSSWTGSIKKINQREDIPQIAAAGAVAPASLVKENWRNFSKTLSEGLSEIKNQFRF